MLHSTTANSHTEQNATKFNSLPFRNVQSLTLLEKSHVATKYGTPVLSPGKLQLPVLGEMLFDGVVDSLNEHVVYATLAKQVRHCR